MNVLSDRVARVGLVVGLSMAALGCPRNDRPAAPDAAAPPSTGEGGAASSAVLDAGAPPAPTVDRAEYAREHAADEVTLHHGPCMGSCPVSTVTVKRDGSVTGSPKSKHVSQDEVSDIFRLVREAMERPCHDGAVPDLPVSTLTMTFGNEKRTLTYQNVSQCPPAVRSLQLRLDILR